jgi:hypothetical protein
MTMKIATLVLPALLLAGPAMAVEHSIGELQSSCISQEASLRLACTSYIEGVFDMMLMNGDLLEDNSLAVCNTEEKLWQGVLVQVFLRWADSHRQLWGLSRATGVIEALSEAYHCKP